MRGKPTAITQALALVVENVSNLSFADYFQQRVWSKLGVKDPFLVALLSDKTALAGGGNFTAIEVFLHYAMIYTPSWNNVSEERLVTNALLKRIQTLGDPKAFEGCYKDTIYDPTTDSFVPGRATYEKIVKEEPGRIVVVVMPYRKPWVPKWLRIPHMTVATDSMIGIGADGKFLPWDADRSQYASNPRTPGAMAKTGIRTRSDRRRRRGRRECPLPPWR